MRFSRRALIKSGLATAALMTCDIPALRWLTPSSHAAQPMTTLERTVVAVPVPATSPKIAATDIAKYAQNGYGVWKFDKGLACQKRLDLMRPDYTGAKVAQAARLTRFFTISDLHITDKESPAQVIFFGLVDAISSAYSPVMLSTTHVLDAAVRTINAIHKQEPIDFGISLGDTCNCTQYNELRWYVDIMDGKTITPSSGAHAGAQTIDYQKPYQAAGLDKSIPWYQAIGNHDQFWIGSAPVDDHLRAAFVGEEILNLGNIFKDGMDSRGYYMGTLDGSTPYGEVIDAGPADKFPAPPKVAADPDRRSLTRRQWLGEFFNTTSTPVGHGFSQDNLDKDFASFVFEPKPGLPLKVIVLDDTPSQEDGRMVNGVVMSGRGAVDKARWEWLIGELDKGQAEGKLMIIAAHVPIGVEKPGAFMSWAPSAYVTQEQFFAKLHEYPNLIMWLAGHRHFNVVTAYPSPDPARPELGFWHVETASLRDFPQQFRTFEIVRNSDDTLSIVTTNVSPAVEDGSPAAKSRAYSIAALQLIVNPEISTSPGFLLPTGSYNAELVVQLTPEMRTKLHKCGTPLRA